MYTISKLFSFEASHQLTGLPEGHQCMRLHGHSYRVELVLYAHALDARGFVVDYGDLKPFEDYLKERLDHRHLNDLLPQPTAEHLARHLYGVAKRLWPDALGEVRVSETQKTWASYTGGADDHPAGEEGTPG